MSKDWCILKIRDGKIDNQTQVDKLFKQLKARKNADYTLEASKLNKRSNPQNNYYWQMLAEYIQPALYNEGWRNIKTKDDAHDFVKDLFLKTKIVNEVTGEVKERTKSTTELSKEEFNVYLEEIAQWSAEYLYLTIPSPGEQMNMDYADN